MIRSPSFPTKRSNQHECSFLSLTLWLNGGCTGGRKATDRGISLKCRFAALTALRGSEFQPVKTIKVIKISSNFFIFFHQIFIKKSHLNTVSTVVLLHLLVADVAAFFVYSYIFYTFVL